MNVFNCCGIIQIIINFCRGGLFTKKAYKITFILAVIAEIICCLGLNTMGGIAFLLNNYNKCGIALFISTFFLVIALIFIKYKKSVIPFILTIIGSAFYIYTLAVLESIPNTKIPKESTEVLASKHFPTIIVTVLLTLLVVFNLFSEEACKKRSEKKAHKKAIENRELSENEKIL